MATDKIDMRFFDKASIQKYYANSKNGIEDPIFTGFTFAIDTLHSPLFFIPDTYEDVVETLVSPNRTPADDNSLAKKIEERLKYVNQFAITANPDTYEINTINVKDSFGSNNSRRPGYGLFDTFDIDNVQYGATDYIYMVDKVTDGTYANETGVSDVGNGTPTTSIYRKYSAILADVDPTTLATQNELDNKVSPIKNIDIFFNCDKYDIRTDQKSIVDTVIKTMNDNPDCSVLLGGYADAETGNPSSNMTLSKNRVETIERALLSGGVSGSRIRTMYLGDTVQPLVGPMNRVVRCVFDGDITTESTLELKIANEANSMTTQKPTIDSDTQGDTTEGNEILKEHNDLKKAATKAEEEFNKLYNDPVYQQAIKYLDNINSVIELQKANIRVELDNFKRDMKSHQEKLNGDSSIDSNGIDAIYDKFKDFCEYIETKKSNTNYDKQFEYITATVNKFIESDVDKFTSEINALSESRKKSYDEKQVPYYSSYNKIWAVLKTTLDNIKVGDDTNQKIQEMKEKREETNKLLYGTYDDGRPGTEFNPAPNSLLKKMNDTKENLANDAYNTKTHAMHQLQDIRENLAKINDYNKYQERKVDSPKILPTIDNQREGESNENYINRIQQERNSRQTYEVPQTVYDMIGFIKGMKSLTTEYPYVLQTVTGLDEAYKKYFEVKDPYMGSGDGKISINCLEFIDMRVTSMFNKYFNAVYDRKYRRERVPINLRRFQCSIFVHDIRNFSDTLRSSISDQEDYSMITKIALNSLSAIEFKFFDCEIVPEETGSIFDNVTNLPNGDMRNTNFTFTYGNCVINFLPFEDLRRYVLGLRDVNEIKPETRTNTTTNNNEYNGRYSITNPSGSDLAGNFRRWYDRSVLGNVNNNDYRDYIRRDSSVAVDDHFKTTMVNNFAMNSLVNKNKELTEMDDALRRIVVGISASTGIPTSKVTDVLNIGFIDPILNESDKATAVVKELGNVNNSKIINTDTTEYIGDVEGETNNSQDIVDDLGNIHTT